MVKRGRKKAIIESDSEVDYTKGSSQRPKVEWEFDFEPSALPEINIGKALPCIDSKRRLSGEQTGSTFDVAYERVAIPFDKLVVHRKKLTELEMWFEQFVHRLNSRQGGILIVSGPTGCGKSTSVRSLAVKFGVQLVDGYEYENNEKKLRQHAFPSLHLVADDGDSGGEGERERERERERGRGGEDGSKSLRPYLGQKAILFDDLPNEDAEHSLCELIKLVDQDPLQIILIVTDPCNYRSLSDSLILRKMVKLPITCSIVFNPIAPSFLKKILKRHNLLSNDRVDFGDARACIVETILNGLSCDSRRANSSRDISFGLFHSVGKILYPRDGKEQIDPAIITEADRPLYHAFLHANYLKHVDDLSSTLQIIETFSWIDSTDWRVHNDHIWGATYSSLPELVIWSVVNDLNRKSRRGFVAVEAPRILSRPTSTDRISDLL
jgi:hypothetical protein